MENVEVNGKIDLGIRKLVVAHVENAITFYGYLVSASYRILSIILKAPPGLGEGECNTVKLPNLEH